MADFLFGLFCVLAVSECVYAVVLEALCLVLP